MRIKICENPKELGEQAARIISEKIKKAIQKNGSARIALSTGASQFDTLEALIKTDVDWSRVEMFHLDEYLGLDESHKASFRKYLKEKFISKINLKAAWLVGNSADSIKELTKQITKSPIDVGLIGIGENAHIAFNDPPADFDAKESYIIVNLSETCKNQQVREGWFETAEDVPKQAISMTVHQIMSCKSIISCVPYAVKAKAVRDTLQNGVTNQIPATILKNHDDFTLFLDKDSASLINEGVSAS